MSAILQITDGTTVIDMLDPDGFLLSDWRQQVPGYKMDGVWSDSPIADWRQLALAHYANVIDEFRLTVNGHDQDAIIRKTQDLFRLLTDAVNYWTSQWNAQPVYIKAQASQETNPRYAVISSWRMPDLPSPFAQPFLQPDCESTMTDFSLFIEHDAWRADIPGSSTCVEAGYVDIGTDDLVINGGFELDSPLWIYYAAPFGDVATRDNTNPRTGIWEGYISCSGVGPPGFRSYISQDIQVIEGETYYLSFWSCTTGATADVTNYSVYDVSNGAFIIPITGATAGAAYLQTTNSFIAPIGCNTVRLYFYNTIVAETAFYDDIVLTGPYAVEYTPTCDDVRYVANKHNRSPVTHIYYYDASGPSWSANLVGAAVPFDFLPAVPAANDIVYFGVDTAGTNSGPFCSLVFNISTAQNNITAIAWEYISNPAGPVWTAFPAADIQDNTNANGGETGVAFDTTGVNSVHWNQNLTVPWVEGAVNGVTGWWVRARVTAANPGATPPTQQTDRIYTVLLPFIAVDYAEVGGDIPALLRVKAHNHSGGLSGPDLHTDRLIVGLRSASRGENYSAYINIADEQNSPWITVARDATDTAFASNVRSPTGRAAQYAPAANRTIADEITIRIGQPLVQEYYGTYRAFLRCYQSGGNAGDIGVRLVVTMSSTQDNEAQVGETVFTGSVDNVLGLELGQFTIPPVKINQTEDVYYTYLVVQLSNSNAPAADLWMFDLILIPVDEWAVDTFDNITSISTTLAYAPYNKYIDIDSTSSPKDILLSTVKTAEYSGVADDIPVAGWVASYTGPAILQANKDQRLWFFAQYTRLVSGLPRRANHEICHTIRLEHVSRYMAMRGNR